MSEIKELENREGQDYKVRLLEIDQTGKVVYQVRGQVANNGILIERDSYNAIRFVLDKISNR